MYLRHVGRLALTGFLFLALHLPAAAQSVTGAGAKAQLAKPTFAGAPLTEAAVRGIVKRDWGALLGWADCSRVLQRAELDQAQLVAPRATSCLQLKFDGHGMQGGSPSVSWVEYFLLDVTCDGTEDDACYRGYVLDSKHEVELTAQADGAWYITETETKVYEARRLRPRTPGAKAGAGGNGQRKTGADAATTGAGKLKASRVGPRFALDYVALVEVESATHVTSGGSNWTTVIRAPDGSVLEESGGFAVAQSTGQQTCSEKGAEAAASVKGASDAYSAFATTASDFTATVTIGALVGVTGGVAATAESGPMGGLAVGIGGAVAAGPPAGDMSAAVTGAVIDTAGGMAAGMTGAVVSALCDHTGGDETAVPVSMEEAMPAEGPEGAGGGGGLDADKSEEAEDTEDEEEEEEDTEEDEGTSTDLKSPSGLNQPGQVKTQP